jgi:hypothetical protein
MIPHFEAELKAARASLQKEIDKAKSEADSAPAYKMFR